MPGLDLELGALRNAFEQGLKKWLTRPLEEGEFLSKRLDSSISYALLGSGKRLRPLLVLSTALAYRRDLSKERAIKRAMPQALAVELIHTYSLIHDDLPAMDDDDFRRGRLSVHRRFDEGLAILAGDALLADAFLLCASCSNNAQKMVETLAKAAGSRALVAGQSEDLVGGSSADAWMKIAYAKTARLFEASALLGALSVGADKIEQDMAKKIGLNFGMAFQIKDDLDDQAGLAGIQTTIDLQSQKKVYVDDMVKVAEDHLFELIKTTFC